MEFGYFTLSDNHYPNNPRSAHLSASPLRLHHLHPAHECAIPQRFDSDRPPHDLIVALTSVQS